MVGLDFVKNDNPHPNVVSLNQLYRNQLKDVKKFENYGRMNFSEIQRLQRYFDGDIFQFCDCCLLKKKSNTFAYSGKKVSIHKLLFHNYIDSLKNKKHIVFFCDNRSRCVNTNHFTYYD